MHNAQCTMQNATPTVPSSARLQSGRRGVLMRRAVVGATILVALASSLAHAQHKIPPIPETAHAPVVLPSGLKYIDIKVGTGVPAAKGRMVRIAFIGWVTK